MTKLIEEIKQDIRDLRDSHFHFCPFELNEQVGDIRKDKIKYFENWLDKYYRVADVISDLMHFCDHYPYFKPDDDEITFDSEYQKGIEFYYEDEIDYYCRDIEKNEIDLKILRDHLVGKVGCDKKEVHKIYFTHYGREYDRKQKRELAELRKKYIDF